MKAILEIELPESCSECGLAGIYHCMGLETPLDINSYKDSRAPECPLKIAPNCAEADKLDDGKCAGYQKSDIHDEPADMCMECKQNEFYEEAHDD